MTRRLRQGSLLNNLFADKLSYPQMRCCPEREPSGVANPDHRVTFRGHDSGTGYATLAPAGTCAESESSVQHCWKTSQTAKAKIARTACRAGALVQYRADCGSTCHARSSRPGTSSSTPITHLL